MQGDKKTKRKSPRSPGVRKVHRNITEVVQSRAERQQSRELHRAIIASATEGICACHDVPEFPYVRFTVWNDRMTEITGYSMEEINTSGWYQTVYPDPEVQARAKARMDRMRQGDNLNQEEWEITRKDGQKRQILISTRIVPGGETGVNVLAVMNDITERKRAEEALRQSEEKFKQLFDDAPVGYFEYDTQGRITRVNQTELQMLGYAPEEMIGQPVWKFMVEEEIARQQILAKLAGTMPPARGLERNYKKKDGTVLPVSIEDRILRDPHGKITCIGCTLQDITDRKKAEEALRRSEEKHRTILENIEEGYFEVDIAGNFTFFNDSLCRLLGYSRDEMMGMNNRQYTDNENAKKMYQTFNRVYRTEIPTKESDWEIIRKDGTKRSNEASLSLIKDPSGNRIGFRGLVRDITKRKGAEEALRENEERYRTLVEGSFDGIFIQKGPKIIFTNRRLSEMLGYDKSEIEGMDHWLIYHPDYQELTRERAKARMRGEEAPPQYEVKLQRKDGSAFDGEILARRIMFGDEPGIQVWVRDITERKRTEEELGASEKRFRELFDEAPVGYHELDQEGKIARVNRTELKMLGYTAEEMVGRYVYEFITEKVSPQSVKGKLEGKLPIESAFERTYIRKDGTLIPVQLEERLMKDREGRIIGIRTTMRDITEHKRAEAEMSSLQEQLRQSQKIEAIGRLSGGIAHDFNNILTTISGNAQLSLLDLKQGDPLRESIEEIRRASERAADLTRQLLAFSRRQMMEMKVLDLNHIVQGLDKMLHRLLGEDIDLVTVLPEGIGKVKADPGQIEQVIINLAVNARDAMTEGGKLTIETADVELDEGYSHRHIAVEPGRYVMLSISDTGGGMSSEVKDRLFEPFFTTKEQGKGTGLGLSTVYGIVKQSGGNIWVYSEPGQGTTFKIYLPQVDEPLTEEKEEVVKEIPRGDETILVVEDEETVRKLAIRLLKSQGYRVLEASDGGKALLLCEKFKERIHLILTDVVMPGMSGRKLVERLKQIHPEMKALYMSGYTDNAIVHHGVLEKGINFMQKPFTLESLTRKVREALDK